MKRLSLLLFVANGMAITLDLSSTSSVTSAANTIAKNLMQYYTGNQPGQVPGLLLGGLNCNPSAVGTYCWWEAGAMWGIMINYWQYTNDSQYNALISQALQFQRGPQSNFNPPNQTKGMGIDDQVFWAYAALDAVESNFPEASGQDDPSWLALAQAVFNFQTAYWDTAICGGGFRWQVYSFNGGYNLKNSISNGGNFQLASRLAYITGNQSYADWAEKVWNWMEQSQLMQVQGDILYIWDSTDANNGCINADHLVWSYNYAVLLAGTAYMYNFTSGAAVWEQRTQQLLTSAFNLFFPQKYGGNIMWELECEDKLICDQNQKSFKAYLARSLAVTSLLVPSTTGQILPKLQGSASAAAAQCNNDGTCGEQWFTGTYDGLTGVGEEVSAPVRSFWMETNVG
jgi:mannan endo-1,6-alpha-mannosidase